MASCVGVFSTALRAPCAAAWITEGTSAPGRSAAFAKPRKIWERMTPELPRAPIRLPWAAMRAILLTSVALESLMSSTADCSVSSMLVPVSPSGTGNTFRRLTSSWLAASQVSDPSSACLKSCPSTLLGVAGSVEEAIFVHPLHVHVHLGHGNADRALDLESH